MKHFISILLAAILCATASAQTIRTLGFNTTNGQVVAATTNTLRFTNDSVAFENITLTESGEDDVSIANDIGSIVLRQTTNVLVEFGTGASHLFYNAISFNNATNAATTRTNLDLPLAALTNTSNITMMRALAGSTNTNEPYSGLISFQDFADDTHTITVSNGIITSYTAP